MNKHKQRQILGPYIISFLLSPGVSDAEPSGVDEFEGALEADCLAPKIPPTTAATVMIVRTNPKNVQKYLRRKPHIRWTFGFGAPPSSSLIIVGLVRSTVEVADSGVSSRPAASLASVSVIKFFSSLYSA